MLAYEDLKPYSEKDLLDVLETYKSNKKKVLPLMVLTFGLTTKNYSLQDRIRTANNMLNSKSKQEFQEYSFEYVEKAVLTGVDSPSNFTISGLENIDKDKGTLIVMNHRDILSDPFNFIYAMVLNNFGMPYCGFGNNLDYPIIGPILRGNNSYILNRIFNKENFRSAATMNSKIITDILDKKHIAWVAQKEGRTKDGKDSTSKSLLFMLSMYSQSKGINFEQFLDKYNVHAANISYRIEPLLEYKARELFIKQGGIIKTFGLDKMRFGLMIDGEYKKAKYEDLNSMIKGLSENNKEVKITISPPIKNIKTPMFAAKEIDKAIIKNQVIYPSHKAAYQHGLDLKNLGIPQEYLTQITPVMKKNTELAKLMMQNYANTYLQTMNLRN